MIRVLSLTSSWSLYVQIWIYFTHFLVFLLLTLNIYLLAGLYKTTTTVNQWQFKSTWVFFQGHWNHYKLKINNDWIWFSGFDNANIPCNKLRAFVLLSHLASFYMIQEKCFIEKYDIFACDSILLNIYFSSQIPVTTGGFGLQT